MIVRFARNSNQNGCLFSNTHNIEGSSHQIKNIYLQEPLWPPPWWPKRRLASSVKSGKTWTSLVASALTLISWESFSLLWWWGRVDLPARIVLRRWWFFPPWWWRSWCRYPISFQHFNIYFEITNEVAKRTTKRVKREKTSIIRLLWCLQISIAKWYKAIGTPLIYRWIKADL